jgi:4a-hydroxytetrahydrobiopterin dehydratase
MPLWTINGAGHLSRSFVAKNFLIAMEFLNSIASIAEANGHHPDMHLTSYRNVELSK